MPAISAFRVAAGAARLKTAGRQQAPSDLTMASRADRRLLVALLQQRVVAAALISDERAGMTRTASAGKVAPVHRASRIVTIENGTVCRQQIEGRSVAAVAAFAADAIAAMWRSLPLVEVSGRIGIGEVTPGATASLSAQRLRCDNKQH